MIAIVGFVDGYVVVDCPEDVLEDIINHIGQVHTVRVHRLNTELYIGDSKKRKSEYTVINTAYITHLDVVSED